MVPRAPHRPLVSVGLPVRNGAMQLGRAMDSILGQTCRDIELLVSDNASSDRSVAVARKRAEQDPRVSVRSLCSAVRAEENFGAALARARGRYFMWAAHDDTWEPEYIACLVAKLESRPTAVLAFSHFNSVNAAGAPVHAYPAIDDLPDDDRVVRLRNFLTQPRTAGKANLIYGVFRRDVLTDCGGMRRWGGGDFGLDMLTVLRVLAEGELLLEQRTMFHKQIAPTPLAPAALHLRWSQRVRDLEATHRFYADCGRVVRASGLPARERRYLLGQVLRLAAAEDGTIVRLGGAALLRARDHHT